MRRQLLLGSLFIFALTGCSASGGQGAESPAGVLPLKRLRLYETGVGYFERSGRMGGADVALPVPAAHVDDALKSLIVVGEDGRASVSAIEFESVVSKGMARALAGLPQDAEKAVDFRGVLGGMKGAWVEVRTEDETFKARVLDVFDAPLMKNTKSDDGDKDKKDTDDDGDDGSPPRAANDPWLLLQTSEGEIRRLHGSQLRGLKPTSAALADRIDDAAETLSVRAARAQRTLRVLASSERPVTLGYIAEVPVWRTSYRLVIDGKSDQAMLQGWALIHNDSDEPWKKVEVELVSGRPDSFLFPLAAPRYSRRNLAEPAEQLSTVPQLVDRTPDQIWGDNVDLVSHGGGTGTGQGYGSGYGRISRAPRVRMGSTSVSGRVSASNELAIGNLAAIAPATGVESGALFSYKLAQAVELRAHGSALVPLFSQRVPVRRLTWFSKPGEAGRSALRLSNGTRQTLPAGTVSVYERKAFAGESGLDRLKPTQRTFFEFGIDLDVELDAKKSKREDSTKRVVMDKGSLIEHFVRRHVRKYEIENRSTQMRLVALKLDVVNNAKATGANEMDYDASNRRPIAVFKVPARSKAERKLEIDEALQRDFSVGSLQTDDLERMMEAEALKSVDKARLKAALVVLKAAEKVEDEKGEAEAEKSTTESDLERLRGHLKAMGDKGGAAAGANPIVTRILAAEDKLTDVRKKIKALDTRYKSELDRLKEELAPLGAAES